MRVLIVDWELVALVAWPVVETARTHLGPVMSLAWIRGCDQNLDCLIANVPGWQTALAHQAASREKGEARSVPGIRVDSLHYYHRSYYQAAQDCHDIDCHLDFAVFAQTGAVAVVASRCPLE